MSNPSIQKENGVKPFDDDFPPWWVWVIFGSAVAACTVVPLHFGPKWMAEGRALREQEWRQAHKDVVSCDFGRGITFSVESTKPADVPEALRPALAAGLANGACRPAFPQN